MTYYVFISYSNTDGAWMDKLRAQLNDFRNLIEIVPWENRELAAGDLWDAEIKQKAQACRVAILLLSPHFMASAYIQQVELPIFRQNEAKGRTKVLPLWLEGEEWKANPWLDAHDIRPLLTAQVNPMAEGNLPNEAPGKLLLPLKALTQNQQAEALRRFGHEVAGVVKALEKRRQLARKALLAALLATLLLASILLLGGLWLNERAAPSHYTLRLALLPPAGCPIEEPLQVRVFDGAAARVVPYTPSGALFYKLSASEKAVVVSLAGASTWQVAGPQGRLRLHLSPARHEVQDTVPIVQHGLDTLFGKVLNTEGLGIYGVKVMAGNAYAYTNPQGMWGLRVKGPCFPATQDLRLEHAAYCPGFFRVAPSITHGNTFQLQPKPCP